MKWDATPQRKFAFSLGFLALGLTAFVWVNVVSGYQTIVASTAAVVQLAENENRKYSRKVSKREAEKKKSTVNIKITSLPGFLMKIDSLALDNGIEINNLQPDAKNGDVYHLEFYSSYSRFETFISALELLDVEIVDLQIHPYNQQLAQPIQHYIISLIPRNDAASLLIPRLTEIRSQLGTAGRRNPFQRLSTEITRTAKEARIDLTWVHHLTAVTTINGRRFATIDDHDYAVDDHFQGKKVTEVALDHVFLEQENNKRKERYVLSFRASKEEQ